MQLIVPYVVQTELLRAMQDAGEREIGGVLMGEHVGPERFEVRRITVQRLAGTFTSFIRLLEGLVRPLARFFQDTNHDYQRFNYLGEWHSHPSFKPVPSGRDENSMWQIVEDPEVGARFAVLLIIRLDGRETMEGTATVFAQGRLRRDAQLVLKGENM